MKGKKGKQSPREGADPNIKRRIGEERVSREREREEKHGNKPEEQPVARSCSRSCFRSVLRSCGVSRLFRTLCAVNQPRLNSKGLNTCALVV